MAHRVLDELVTFHLDICLFSYIQRWHITSHHVTSHGDLKQHRAEVRKPYTDAVRGDV